MSMVEYKLWKLFAMLGLVCWVIMPFLNIKLFGIAFVGFVALLFVIAILYPITKRFFATTRIAYVVSVGVLTFLGGYFHLAALDTVIISAMLMMSGIVFTLASCEMAPVAGDK